MRHNFWFGLPPTFIPWPWRRLYVTYSVPAVRFLGYVEMEWDSATIPMFGFWFFHILLDD